MPLPSVLGNCLDAVSNRLEELSYHCKQLHALNQSLEMENASMRLKLSDIEQALPQRQDFEGQEVNAVATPEVAEAVKPQAPKDVFLRPESDDELPLPGVLPIPVEPSSPHPWLPEGSPGSGSSLRAIGVAPSRMTSFQTLRDVDEDDDPDDGSDPDYVDAKSMRFDTLVSHRLQLVTDTRLADDTFFHKGEWKQTLTLCGSLEDHYDTSRPSEVIVNSVIFKTVSTLAIAANALYIGIRTDQQLKHSYNRINGAMAVQMSNTFEYAFFVWFSAEVILYLVAFRMSFFIGKNWYWNMFDLFLIANAALELLIPDLFANMSFLRICRVFRLVRVVRLVRTVKWLRSLRTMLFAMISSLGSLIWAFVMICFIMFVFSIIFGNAAVSYFDQVNAGDSTERDDADAVYDSFGSLFTSFVTLFGAIFGGTDWMIFQPTLSLLGSGGYGELYFCMFLFYIGFCLVGLLNVVTGIFVDSAVTTRTEDEVVDSYREDLQRTSDEVQRIFHSADVGDSGRLTLEAGPEEQKQSMRTCHWKAFSRCLKQNAWVAAYFAGLDIGADDAGTIFTLMDTNGSGDITVEEFVQGTMKLKGHAKSIDIFAIMFDMTRLGLQVQKLCSLVEDQFRDIKRMVEPDRPLTRKRLFKPLKRLMEELDLPEDDDPTRSCRLRLLKRLSQARVA
ncbi:scn4aa [Symbiodinium sp. CCMP2592]|nr:scn4aa [Symbiodinium sp. CCMP2592]